MSSKMPEVPLEDLAAIAMGQSPPASSLNTDEQGLPFLQGCAEFGPRIPLAKLYCSPPLRVGPAGGTLISVRAPVGTINKADQDYCIGRGLAALKAKQSIGDDTFLRYAVEENVEFLRRRSQGSTFLAIAARDLQQMPVAAPHLPRQRRIAEILSTVDEAIEQTEKLIAKHQQIKAGLMHDLFTRGLTPDGHLRPPQAEAPHLYKYSPLGPIPKEWDCTTLGDACELIQDGTHLPPARVESGPLLLSVQNMIDGDFQLTAADTRVNEEFYAQMHSSWSIKPKDVLLAVVGATIGKVCRVPEDFPKFTLQRSVAVLRGKRGLLQSTYLYWYLLGTSFRARLWTRVNQTAQPGIYLDQLAKLEVPVCASFEQTRVCAPLEEIHRNIKALKAELSKLRATKRGLMHDLLTGRVPVPILEGDDDA